MPIVILQGSPQKQFDIGGSMKPGGLPVHLTDSEIKTHSDIIVRVLDAEVKKPVEVKVENKEPETSTEKLPTEFVELDIERMSKDDLEVFALQNFDVDLDKRKSIRVLREEVKSLMEKK